MARPVAELELKVGEAKQRDVGKARARLPSGAMKALAAATGELVELDGKRKTAAIAWPLEPGDEAHGMIRIDGQTRKNAGVSINEYVRVKKAEPHVARSITLTPISASVPSDTEFAEFVRNRLKGIPVTVSDEVSVVILGSPIVFSVVKAKPAGIVKIEQTTRLFIAAEKVAEKPSAPRVSYEEIGGLREIIARMRETVELPLRHPEIFQRLGVEPPKGVLLHGPPGCGKTLLAKALANESEANFYSISGPEIMNKYYGETEARLRDIFKQARENAPSIIFIDEIDAIAPKREEAFGDVEKRVVAQLLALMDGMVERGHVVVMGATNRLESVDPALRRPGRFDREVEIGVPNSSARLEILQIHTRGMPLAKDFDPNKLASELHGYTGADIKALCQEAAMKALHRHLPDAYQDEKISPEVLEKMEVASRDFDEARKEIVPSALREFYVETPSAAWNDIGGLQEARKALEENVGWALREPARFEKMGVTPPKGVLLYGPSGCGKTLLAKALAAETGVNLITVRGPEVLSKWLGESEKAVRDIYRKAKAAAPCLVFLDEVDAIARPRDLEYGEWGGGERVLSQLLTEIDSLSPSARVLTVAATNRPDMLEPSLLRPGRLDLLLYIPPPGSEGRAAILRRITANMPLAQGVSVDNLAEATRGYSGADLRALCREAALQAIRDGTHRVTPLHFDEALKKVRPTITPEVEGFYEIASQKLSAAGGVRVGRDFYR